MRPRMIILIAVATSAIGTTIAAMQPYYGALPTQTRLVLTAIVHFLYGLAIGSVLRLIVGGKYSDSDKLKRKQEVKEIKRYK